jgi:hypothetical protein
MHHVQQRTTKVVEYRRMKKSTRRLTEPEREEVNLRERGSKPEREEMRQGWRNFRRFHLAFF